MIAASADALSAPVIYGFTLGLVGAVNPCGFPLLPAYLMMSASDAAPVSVARRAGRALGSGLAVTAGIVVVFALLGAVDTGASLALGWVAWVMVPVGLAMLAVGLLGVAGRAPRLPQPRRGLLTRSRHRAVGLFGFGVTYAVASLTCELPVFLAGVAGSFTAHGAGTGIPVALSFALGMGLVITAVSVAGMGTHVVRLRRLRAWQPTVARVAAGVVAVVGAYLALYWVADLVSPLSAPAPVRVVERVQAALANWLSASPRLTGAAIAAAIVVVLAAALVAGLRDDLRADRHADLGAAAGSRHQEEQHGSVPGHVLEAGVVSKKG